MGSAPDGGADAAPAPATPSRTTALVMDPRVLVPTLVVVESLHWIFARVLVPLAPPATAGLYMLTIATIEVALVVPHRIRLATLVRHWRFFTTIGLCVGINTNLGFLAVHYVDPGTAALLTRTSIIFGVALGLLWLGERLSRRELAGAAIAIAGVVIIGVQPGDYFRLGSILVVIASFLYAFHSAVVKRWGGQIAFAEFFFFRLASTAVVLVVLAGAQGAIIPLDAWAWAVIALAATINVVLSRAIYYLALRRLDMSRLTIMVTLSPVATMLWAAVLFGSRPSLQEAAGGAAILAGVIVVVASRGGRV